MRREGSRGAAPSGEQCGESSTLNTELPYDPAVPPLGSYLKKTKTTNSKRYTPPLSAAAFTVTQVWRRPQCPLSCWSLTSPCPSVREWMKLCLAVCVFLFVTTWVNLQGLMLSQIRHRKTSTMLHHLQVAPKKNKKPSPSTKRTDEWWLGACGSGIKRFRWPQIIK